MTNIIARYKEIKWINIFVIYLRYLIGGTFVFSAMPKILGERFLTSNCEDAPIDSFPHLFETLFRSGLYWEFLGWAQVIAALLLMTQFFATLGALMFLPVILNIFVITLSYQFGGTPIITGLLLLANLFLLIWDFDKLQVLLIPASNKEFNFKNPHHIYFNNRFWIFLGLTLFITTVVYVLKYDRNPTAWFCVCIVEGVVGLLYISRKFRKQAIQSKGTL